MNSDTGDMQPMDTFKDIFEAQEKGYTQIFSEGQVLYINGCFFVVNNFIEKLNFMNLRLVSREEAIKLLQAGK